MSGFESKRQASKDLLEPQAEPVVADPFTYIIQHLNSSTYNITKDECIHFIKELRTRYAAPQAQPAPAPAYTEGRCAEKAKKGGCQLHNLHCGYPACDRRPAAPAVAEPLTDDELRECFTGTNTAEPLSEGWPGLERFARAVEQAHGIKRSAA